MFNKRGFNLIWLRRTSFSSELKQVAQTVKVYRLKKPSNVVDAQILIVHICIVECWR
jgi:hypothetical protein